MSIIEHSGLDPKASILVKVYKDVFPASVRTGSSATSDALRALESESCFDSLEVWSLSDVVYLDDSPAILGRVVTVDQLQAIVDISHSSSESGTMDSTSAALSTLKVFKLTEIESCMDRGLVSVGRTTLLKGGEGLKGDSPLKDAGAKVVTVSQHIAGIVQHRPACLLNPSTSAPTHPSSSGGMPHPPRDPERGGSPCTCIHGYYPLAVHITDNGPVMLIKRIRDGAAFLVCSGHTGFPSFSNSSFVSLSSRDSKPGRVTIEQESVAAACGGFDRLAWSTNDSPDERLKDSSVNNGLIQDEGLNVVSNGLNVSENEVPRTVAKISPHPSFTRLHKSDAIVLQDSNGIISPLSGGLRLKPCSLPGHQMRSGPVQPYRCIASRFHWAKKDCGTMIVVLGE